MRDRQRRARALYAAYGFEKVAERKAYYRTIDAREASAFVMRLDLPEDI